MSNPRPGSDMIILDQAKSVSLMLGYGRFYCKIFYSGTRKKRRDGNATRAPAPNLTRTLTALTRRLHPPAGARPQVGAAVRKWFYKGYSGQSENIPPAPPPSPKIHTFALQAENFFTWRRIVAIVPTPQCCFSLNFFNLFLFCLHENFCSPGRLFTVEVTGSFRDNII